MAETTSLTGRCLCGAVRFTAAKAERHVGACHCDMRRRWNGGPALAVECGTEVNFEGAEHVSAYRSSDWAERAFCSRCGSGLYYKVLATGDLIMNAGLFDDQTNFLFTGEIFIDEKPGWYEFTGERERKTGAEFMAEVAPKGG